MNDEQISGNHFLAVPGYINICLCLHLNGASLYWYMVRDVHFTLF